MQVQSTSEYETMEMQMGPMIDVVFLLLIFFMVTAKPIKPEADVSMSLPGSVPQEETLELPDEIQIEIVANGELRLNQMVVAKPGDTELTDLLAIMVRLRKAADDSKSEALVSIVPDKNCLHQRIVDVLNVAAKAKITGVTFAPPLEDSGAF